MLEAPEKLSVGQLETIRLFNVPIANATMAQAVRLVEDHIIFGKRLDIGVVNAAKLVAMQTDEQLRNSVLSSDVIFADGQAVVWASRLVGQPLTERVAGIDLMYALLERGSQIGLRVYCLGAEEWVSAQVAQNIRDRYPGIQLAGRRNGYFSQDEEAEIVRNIRDSAADILFVAMSSPMKENFMARWGDAMSVTVTHGVGGSFDVLAGKVKRAPKVLQRMGLEWLFRVLQEPGRLWHRYMTSNIAFLRMLFRSAPPDK